MLDLAPLEILGRLIVVALAAVALTGFTGSCVAVAALSSHEHRAGTSDVVEHRATTAVAAILGTLALYALACVIAWGAGA